MPYICLRRTDIPEAILQILDLWPNTSQRNLIYDPVGQTKYVSFVPENDTVTTSGAPLFTTASNYYGIAAYLADHIVSGGLLGGTAPLSNANLLTLGAAILARMRAGYPMTEAYLDTYLSAVVAGTGFATGGSTGVVIELLAILSGERYLLPTTINLAVGGVKIPKDGDHSTNMTKFDVLGFNTPQCDATWAGGPSTWTATRDIHVTKGVLDAGTILAMGAFTLYYSESFTNNGTITGAGPTLEVAGGFVSPNRVRHTYAGLPLMASCNEGHLYQFKQDSFDYLDVLGAAIVVYDDTGALL